MQKEHLSPADSHLRIGEYVQRGRAIVERQRQLIAQIRANRHDSTDAENLLRQFEASLAIFEQDLASIERNKAR